MAEAMVHTRAWRNFKRMQDITAVAAGLLYVSAAIQAVDTLPHDAEDLTAWVLLWPAGFLLLTMVLPLSIPPLRRALARYVWMSFRAGFGQTAASVLVGAGMLAGAGAFIHWELEAAAGGARLRANVFSAFAAGIGVLAAQAALVRTLERLPEVRRLIEE